MGEGQSHFMKSRRVLFKKIPLTGYEPVSEVEELKSKIVSA